jgi:hypothetical protein
VHAARFAVFRGDGLPELVAAGMVAVGCGQRDEARFRIPRRPAQVRPNRCATDFFVRSGLLRSNWRILAISSSLSFFLDIRRLLFREFVALAWAMPAIDANCFCLGLRGGFFRCRAD